MLSRHVVDWKYIVSEGVYSIIVEIVLGMDLNTFRVTRLIRLSRFTWEVTGTSQLESISTKKAKRRVRQILGRDHRCKCQLSIEAQSGSSLQCRTWMGTTPVQPCSLRGVDSDDLR